MKRSAENRRWRSTRGESMVVAVVLMLVFFILGLTVLTGASVAKAGVNARQRSRQAYYYARSMLDVLDESLCRGDLGEELLKQELRQVQNNRPYQKVGQQMRIEAVFEGSAPEGMTLAGGAALFSYDVRASKSNQDKSAEITLTNAVLSFRVEYEGQSYNVRVSYSFTGTAHRDNNGQNTPWIWDTYRWRVGSVT